MAIDRYLNTIPTTTGIKAKAVDKTVLLIKIGYCKTISISILVHVLSKI